MEKEQKTIGFILDKFGCKLSEKEVTKVQNGRVYFLDSRGKESWNKIETDMHQWILGTKEEANSVLDDFLVSKIQYHKNKMEYFEELLSHHRNTILQNLK